MSGFVQDIRFALRALRRSPGFATIAIAMLALGIGINATVFTVTNAVLFKGFPGVERNDRLLYISSGGCCISYPDFDDIRAQTTSFSGMGLTHGIGEILNDGAGFPEHIEVTEISAGTFQTAGREPLLGRDLAPSDEADGAAPVAILNYGFWERRYAKNPAVIGRTVRVNGAPTTIIGVMPADFSFPQKVDIWTPLIKTLRVMNRNSTDTWFAFGRVKDGVTIESAQAELEGVIKRLETEYPVSDRRFHLIVQGFAGFFIGPTAPLIYRSMFGAVGFVLLIACANLANLLLARALGRSREISVRIALGAGRWRVIRQLLIESLMLSTLSGTLGWWIAKAGVQAYSTAMAQKSSWLIVDYSMDHRVLGYLVAISIATGILFGLAPALRLSRLDVNVSLKDAGRSSTSGGGHRQLATILVAAEMALAIVLLAGAGVMIRSFLKIHTAQMGVNTAQVLIGSLDLPAAKYGTGEARVSFYGRLTAELQSAPGAESVALAETLPSWNAPRVPYELEGEPAFDPQRRSKILTMKISPGYFRTLGARVWSGRDFNSADVPSAIPAAIVNRAFADKYWPGQDPVGKRLRLFNENSPGPWLTVVGVASNIVQNDNNRQRYEPLVYTAFAQAPNPATWVLVRSRVPPLNLATAFRRDVQELDADLPMYGPFELANRLESYWDSRFYGALFLIFAALALLLASIGIYSVIAHSVRQRTQEIGIRLAVGASTRDILRLVLMQGMLPLGIGLLVGLAGSLAVNQILKAVLVQVSPSDPVTLFAASATLLLSATLGCLIPIRRALRVDPVIALRYE